MTLAMISCIFQISEENCRDLVAMDWIRYEESIYCRKPMSGISHICCNVSLIWLRAVKRPWSDKDVTRMMDVGRDCLFFASPIFGQGFLFGMIFTWNWEDMSLFECKRSDSVLYNVILIIRGTIFFTPQNAQLLARRHLIGISKVACWGEGMCLNCVLMLTSFN